MNPYYLVLSFSVAERNIYFIYLFTLCDMGHCVTGDVVRQETLCDRGHCVTGDVVRQEKLCDRGHCVTGDVV